MRYKGRPHLLASCRELDRRAQGEATARASVAQAPSLLRHGSALIQDMAVSIAESVAAAYIAEAGLAREGRSSSLSSIRFLPCLCMLQKKRTVMLLLGCLIRSKDKASLLILACQEMALPLLIISRCQCNNVRPDSQVNKLGCDLDSECAQVRVVLRATAGSGAGRCICIAASLPPEPWSASEIRCRLILAPPMSMLGSAARPRRLLGSERCRMQGLVRQAVGFHKPSVGEANLVNSQSMWQ